MMGRTGREVQLAEYPRGEVQASDFRVVAAQIPEPGRGEVLVRNAVMSVDPAGAKGTMMRTGLVG